MDADDAKRLARGDRIWLKRRPFSAEQFAVVLYWKQRIHLRTDELVVAKWRKGQGWTKPIPVFFSEIVRISKNDAPPVPPIPAATWADKPRRARTRFMDWRWEG